MYKYKKNKINYVVLSIILILLFLCVLIFNKKEKNLNFIEKGVKDITSSVVSIFIYPVNFISDKIEYLDTNKKLIKKLKKLEKEKNLYEYNKTLIEELKSENKHLLDELDLKTSLLPNKTINATTITRSLDTYYDYIIIDKGMKDNIEKGDAVINSKGLIGTVITASNHTSTVRLLTSLNFTKISVKIKVEDGYVYGLLSGYDKEKNIFIVEGISENTEIKKGDKIITTGLGKTFTSGILVGNVSLVTKDNFDLAKTLEVKPVTNFSDINYVTVLKRGEKDDN